MTAADALRHAPPLHGGGSVLLFGGGMKRGFVYGKTADERPCTTIENPVPLEDLHATMYQRAGHRAHAVLRDGEAARSMSPRTARAK